MSRYSHVDNAFKVTPRRLFLPEIAMGNSILDTPIPIGYGQTNSQPSTVYQMLCWLDVRPDENVLDIGSGSGWTSALLSRLVGQKGKVTAIEIVPELLEFGKANCEKVGLTNIKFYKASNNVVGYPRNSPYDKILVSAAASKLPSGLLDQLDINGTIVIPINNSIYVIHKKNNNIKTIEYPGYAFVPLL
jgi:protein-L-isoaspartate(D-aspartate) O-methyltransferase